jgi:hypothetical protein
MRAIAMLAAGLVVGCLYFGGNLEAADAPAKPCSSAQYHQFDFWVGDWDVYNPAGKKVGENRITREEGGCLIHEHWHGAGGGTGQSLNTYDLARGVWHQTWVGSSGTVLIMDGGLKDGSMVLEETRPGVTHPGKMVHHKITWTPLPSGDVRQHWEVSLDGDKTWKTLFDGRYVRKKASR